MSHETKPKLGEGATPGPWRVRFYYNTAEIETIEQEDGKYRHITNDLPMLAAIDEPQTTVIDDRGDERKFGAESVANARLIAKAPLLVQARDVLEAFAIDGRLQTFKDRERFRVQARTLLAKLEE